MEHETEYTVVDEQADTVDQGEIMAVTLHVVVEYIYEDRGSIRKRFDVRFQRSDGSGTAFEWVGTTPVDHDMDGFEETHCRVVQHAASYMTEHYGGQIDTKQIKFARLDGLR